MASRAAAARARSNSLRQGLAEVPLPNGEEAPTLATAPSPSSTAATSARPPPAVALVAATFWSDLKTFRWCTNPASSLKAILTIVALWAGLELVPRDLLAENPLSHALFISHQLPDGRYTKGLHDLSFIAFYIIVFSFIRQGVTEFLLRPLAKWSGLKSASKQTRFMEQAYAVVYNTATAALGLYVMYDGPLWFYKTEHFWLEYPHWQMTAQIKYYYLLQASYWCQQMLVLGLRLEKPRSDYYQLIVHHLVTLWLIGWSYALNLTQIGVAIYISMDIPEIFLAGSKCLNYVGLQHTSEVSFVALLLVWTYFRHYLNLLMMWSVWYEFDLIPEYNRTWLAPASSPKDWWVLTAWDSGRIPEWLKYQIFIPIFLLHCVNVFWSYLLWRLLYRLVVGVVISDLREEGETDEEAEEAAAVAAETKKER